MAEIVFFCALIVPEEDTMTTSNDTGNTCLTRRLSHSLIVFFLVVFSPLTIHAYELLMGTGEKDSFSHFTGRTLCRLISIDSELSCKAIPAPDSSHNLTNLRGGSLDIALIDSRILHDAFNKSGYFKFLDITYDNLRTLVPLYTVPIVLVARDDAKILSLDDLQGKRFNAGAPLSPQHLAADNIMVAKGWTKRDFNPLVELPVNHAQGTLAFSGGTIQAMLHIGVHPDPILARLLERAKATLVDMDDPDIEKLVNTHSGFVKITIPAGTYSTNPEKVDTLGTEVSLVASEDLDDTTVTAILAAIFHSKEQLKKAHPTLSPTREAGTNKLQGEVQPHRAVIKYFQK